METKSALSKKKSIAKNLHFYYYSLGWFLSTAPLRTCGLVRTQKKWMACTAIKCWIVAYTK